jgi:molybdenum cofactor cytidylyltransferase
MGGKKISAVILAAGYSGRMESFKPLLCLGGVPLVGRTIESFQKAGISDVIVVVGHWKEKLASILAEFKVNVIVNENYAEGMFSSVKAGLAGIRPAAEAFFILPADVPLVSPGTIRYLVESYRRYPGKILVPTFEGRNGHPPLIASNYEKSIINYGGDGGLKSALHQFESETVRLPVPDENILFDVDVPADYGELQERWKRMESAEKSRRGTAAGVIL